MSPFEPILEVLPSPHLLIERGTARVLYANPAARALSAGALPDAVLALSLIHI